MSDHASQRTLDGDEVEYPDCAECESEATVALTLRGFTVDEVVLCDSCDFEPGPCPGGVESERRLTPNDPAVVGGESVAE